TASVRFQVFTEDTGGGGGAPRFDAATFSQVPVPGAIFLMGPALLGLAGLGRKKA
ncbi:MAG: hypothetical protein HKO62_08560, partial [Gammaproteobacteria bacterium]|nr:hypothetical protein [Gammaproteobacteria bacterium]